MCLALFKKEGVIVPEEHVDKAWTQHRDGAGFAYLDGKKVVIEKGFMTSDDMKTRLKALNNLKNTKAILHWRYATHGTVDKTNCHPFKIADGALVHNGTIRGFGESTHNSKLVTRGPETVDNLKEKLKLVWSYDDVEATVFVEDLLHGVENSKRWKNISMMLDVLVKDQELAFHINPPHSPSDTNLFVSQCLSKITYRQMPGILNLLEQQGSCIQGSRLITLHNNGSYFIINEKSGTWVDGVWHSNNTCAPNYTRGDSTSTSLSDWRAHLNVEAD